MSKVRHHTFSIEVPIIFPSDFMDGRFQKNLHKPPPRNICLGSSKDGRKMEVKGNVVKIFHVIFIKHWYHFKQNIICTQKGDLIEYYENKYTEKKQTRILKLN